jgi:hypothetical protein
MGRRTPAGAATAGLLAVQAQERPDGRDAMRAMAMNDVRGAPALLLLERGACLEFAVILREGVRLGRA